MNYYCPNCKEVRIKSVGSASIQGVSNIKCIKCLAPLVTEEDFKKNKTN